MKSQSKSPLIKCSRIVLLLTILTIISNTHAAVKVTEPVVLIATGTKTSRSLDFKTLRASPIVQKVENVFSPSEQRMLREMGQAIAAQGVKLTVASEAKAIELRSWIQKKKLKLQLENNAVASTLSVQMQTIGSGTSVKPQTSGSGSTDRFFAKQWALENTGQVERLDENLFAARNFETATQN